MFSLYERRKQKKLISQKKKEVESDDESDKQEREEYNEMFGLLEKRYKEEVKILKDDESKRSQLGHSSRQSEAHTQEIVNKIKSEEQENEHENSHSTPQ